MAKENKTDISEQDKDLLADCDLAKAVRAGYVPQYSCPGNGLPEVTVKSAPAWSPFPDPNADLVSQGKVAVRENKTGVSFAGDAAPFADCILERKVRAGYVPKYSYPNEGLPEVTVKSAPAWSPFPDPNAS